MERRNVLKNIVFQRILEVRREKSKPMIKDILKVYRRTKTKEQQNVFVDRLKTLYHGDPISIKSFSEDE